MEGRGGIKRRPLTGVHGGGAVDYVGIAASWLYNLVKRLLVELTSDFEIEILLVGSESRLENVVEIVGEVRRGIRNVAEVMKVLLDLG